MKYFLSSIMSLLVIIAVPFGLIAQTTFSGEHIANFQQSTIINADGTIDVTEQIEYDFSTEERHGIFRTIPYTKLNSEGKKFKMTFSQIFVVDENGQPYTFTNTDESGAITLKIGDPDVTITGKHTYVIRYQVSGALTYFSDHDELYWNVTGDEWDVPIALAQSSVTLPGQIYREQIQMDCFRGKRGTDDQCAQAVVGNTILFDSEALEPGDGMTIVAGFPKGVVAVLEPQEVTDFFETFIGRLVFIGLMIVGFFWYIAYPLWLPLKWWTEGRDPSTLRQLADRSGQVHSGVVRAWFDPPKINGRELTPAETGTLIDERVQTREIVALIIHLAQRGYFKIVEKNKKDFDLVKQDKPHRTDTLLTFEDNFITTVFKDKTHVSINKSTKLYTAVTSATDEIYEQTVKDGFFPENPEKVRSKYTIIAGVAVVTFNFFLSMTSAVFGQIMPRKTLEGVHASNTARSLKNFLESQKRQLTFQADKQMMFEKLLPYAIAFGVENKWAQRFKNLKMKNLAWYKGQGTTILTAAAFTHNLSNSFGSSFTSAITPTSSSSGFSSGFSGGSSGGGGGGGSW